MSIKYIPSETLSRKDCEVLNQKYTQKGELGKGAYGKVYEACLKGTSDCGYVLKVITYDHVSFKRSGGSARSLEKIYSDWRNEVKVFMKLNKCQEKYNLTFSPTLYDAWYCDKGSKVFFYLLIERYDGDLSHLISEQDLALSMALDRMDSYLAIIHTDARICLFGTDGCLNDVKIENILYKKTGPKSYSLVFSDFGLSTRHSDEICTQRDRDRFKDLIDIYRND